MQGNDLGSGTEPRLILVFEGLIGFLPTKKAELTFKTSMKFHRWGKAVSQFVPNEQMERRIYDITYNKGFNVEALTFLGDQMQDHVMQWIDDHYLPIGRVRSHTPDELSKKLAYMPDVAAIYHPFNNMTFKFGGKGRYLDPSGSLDIIGSF
jgi:hypothetical protein